MIQLEITGVHYDLNPKIKRYVEQKIGKLDRYIPKDARSSSHGHVILTEEEGKSKNRFICEVNITFPRGTVVAKEATVNMFAAVDIVEAKVKNQLLKHKGKQKKKYRNQRLLRRFRRSGR